MNKVFLSGQIVDWLNVGDEIGVAILREMDSKKRFYVWYEKRLFPNLLVKTFQKKVLISGQLDYIKVKMDELQRIRRTNAIKLEEIELLDDDF